MSVARGTYLKLFDAQGEIYCVSADDEPRVDAGVSAWIDCGGTRDVLLDLTMLEGSTLKILASQIVAWAVSTPEHRERRIVIDQESDAEYSEMRRANGIWDDSE